MHSDIRSVFITEKRVNFIFLIFILVLLFFSEFSYSTTIEDICPNGFRNDTTEYTNQYSDSCEANTGVSGGFKIAGNWKVYDDVGHRGCFVTKVAIDDCAADEDDTADNEGCYPIDYPDGVCPTQECTTSTGITFNLAAGKSCSDYSEVDNNSQSGDEATENCEGSPNCIINDGGANGGSTDGPDGSGDGGGGDGDSGGGDETGGDPSESDCVTGVEDDPSTLQLNECTGETSGSGLDPDPDPETDPPTSEGCADYSACRAKGISDTSCDDGNRDYFLFQFISAGDFVAECEACGGPNSLSFSQCQDGACDYGFNSITNKCWTIDCPHGDCIDPDAPDSQAEAPPENSDNTQERLSEVITAINAVKNAIANNETPEKVDQLRIEVSQKITTQTAELSEVSDSNTAELVESLKKIELKISEDGDYTDLLTEVKKNTKDVSCALNPNGSGCSSKFIINDPDVAELSTVIVEGITDSGIYTALSEFKDISINVTSDCPSTFRFQLSFIGTYTIDVCAIFQPIVPLIRALFIAFWGLVSFRALTDA